MEFNTNLSKQVKNFKSDKKADELYNKICELLIAAGYSRARLPNLEPLDKILGGITWSLMLCFVEVEFEYKDEMSLGEKIRICEKITKALKLANCPINVNPVQLQGLDLETIFTLFQWLIKNIHETEDQRKNFSKNIALSYSNKFVENKCKNLNDKDNIISGVSDIKQKYLIKGRQLRTVNAKSKLNYNDELRIYLSLLEFDTRNDLSFQKSLIDLLRKRNMINESSNNDKSTTNSNKFKIFNRNTSENEKETKLNESEEISNRLRGISVKKNNNILSDNDLSELDSFFYSNDFKIENVESSNNEKIQASILEEILNNNYDDIATEFEKIKSFENNEEFDHLKIILKEKERLISVKQNIIKQINIYNNEISELEKIQNNSENSLLEITNKNRILNEEITSNESKLELLENKIKEAKISQENIELITDKIDLRESLKEEISFFKSKCKDEKKQLEAKLEQLEIKKEKMMSDENKQAFGEIDSNYNSELNNLINKKQFLFEENKEINVLLRKIQVNPSKLELLQYQKRFEELYDQINLVNEKNRELINDINAKEEVKKLLNQKKQTFMDLKDVYSGLKQKKEKENFKKNLEELVKGVVDSANRSGEKPINLNKDLEKIKKQFMEYQEYEQKYMMLVKDYNREYNKLYSKITS